MHKRDFAGAIGMRMRIHIIGFAMCGPARMTNPDIALHGAKVQYLF